MAIFSTPTMETVHQKLNAAATKFYNEANTTVEQIIYEIPFRSENVRSAIASFNWYNDQYKGNKTGFMEDRDRQVYQDFMSNIQRFTLTWRPIWEDMNVKFHFMVDNAVPFNRTFTDPDTMELITSATKITGMWPSYDTPYQDAAKLLPKIDNVVTRMNKWFSDSVPTATRVADVDEAYGAIQGFLDDLMTQYDSALKIAYEFKIFILAMQSAINTALSYIDIYQPSLRHETIMGFIGTYYDHLKEWFYVTSSKVYNETDNMYVELPLIIDTMRKNEPQRLDLIFRQTVLWEMISTRRFDVRDPTYQYSKLEMWRAHQFLMNFFVYDEDPALLKYKGSAIAKDSLGNDFMGYVESDDGVKALFDGGFPKYYNASWNNAATPSALSNAHKIMYNFLKWSENKTVTAKRLLCFSSARSTDNYAGSGVDADDFRKTVSGIAALAGYYVEFFDMDQKSVITPGKLNEYTTVIVFSSGALSDQAVADMIYDHVSSTKSGIMVITDHDYFQPFANQVSKRFGVEFFGNVDRVPIDVATAKAEYGDHPIWAGITGEVPAGGSEGNLRYLEHNGVELPEVIPPEVDEKNLYSEYDVRWTTDALFLKMKLEHQHSLYCISDHVLRSNNCKTIHDQLIAVLNDSNRKAFTEIDETEVQKQVVLAPDLRNVAVKIADTSVDNQTPLEKIVQGMASRIGGRGLKLYYPWERPIVLIMSVVGQLKFNVACVNYNQTIDDLIGMQ